MLTLLSCRCGRNAIVKEKCDVHVSSPTLLRSGKESREEINLQNYVTHHHKATVDLIKEPTYHIQCNLEKVTILVSEKTAPNMHNVTKFRDAGTDQTGQT